MASNLLAGLAQGLQAVKRAPVGGRAAAQRLAAARLAHAAHTGKAIERYRAVIPSDSWVPTYLIEQRLGYGRTVANAFLRKLVKQGLVQRRPRDNEDFYNRKRGWEYRWIK